MLIQRKGEKMFTFLRGFQTRSFLKIKRNTSTQVTDYTISCLKSPLVNSMELSRLHPSLLIMHILELHLNSVIFLASDKC